MNAVLYNDKSASVQIIDLNEQSAEHRSYSQLAQRALAALIQHTIENPTIKQHIAEKKLQTMTCLSFDTTADQHD